MNAYAKTARRGLHWLALLLWLPLQALAQLPAGPLPENGYWWNPNDPGSGFVIEVQGSNLFFASFLYAGNGEATWLASTGLMTSNTQYSGQLTPFFGGQTLTGSYQAPAQLASVGSVAINFISTTQAVLTWPGGTIPIERFNFAYYSTPPANAPQTGYWYNPNESGRGYTIELQGDQIFLAGYMYDDTGNPIWYLATGPLVNSAFQGEWQQYGGGTTLTGTFKLASIVNANVGSVTLQFASSTSATLTLPDGRQIPLARFNFNGPGTIPAGLWQAPAGSTPQGVNYVYLTGTAGDPIVGANTYVYTPANAVLQISGAGDTLEVQAVVGSYVTGYFQSTAGISPIAQGYYPNVTSWPRISGNAPALEFSAFGLGCTLQSGWFVVDDIVFSSAVKLASLDMRFEQLCQGASAPMYGQVHYVAANATVGEVAPVVPVPSGLWQPSGGSTPASGNYVYLQSDAGDPIGGGKTTIFTPPACTIEASAGNNSFGTLFAVAGIQVSCTTGPGVGGMGSFEPMNGLPLAVGYYPNISQYPFGDPAVPMMDWGSYGRCQTITGWFAIDNLASTNSVYGQLVSAIDIRFEQHCNGMTPALRGQIHWVNGG